MTYPGFYLRNPNCGFGVDNFYSSTWTLRIWHLQEAGLHVWDLRLFQVTVLQPWLNDVGTDAALAKLLLAELPSRDVEPTQEEPTQTSKDY